MNYVEEDSSQSRHKRAYASNQTTFYVKLRFLIDYSIYKIFLDSGMGAVAAVNATKSMFSFIYHALYLVFYNIKSDRIAIRLFLKYIHIPTTLEAASYVQFHTNDSIDVSKNWGGIYQYIREQGGWPDADHTMFWTSLGAPHDYKEYFANPDCHSDQEHIMRRDAEKVHNWFIFSKCSVFMFEQCIKGQANNELNISEEDSSYGFLKLFPRTCVYHSVCTNEYPVEEYLALPGQTYSLTEQCQLKHGNLSYFFYVEVQTEYHNVCRRLWCAIGTTYDPHTNAAADGSPCKDDDGDSVYDDTKISLKKIKFALKSQKFLRVMRTKHQTALI